MVEVRDFVKTNLRSFVREQREKAHLSPDFKINGYVLGDVEQRAETIPCRDLFPILEQLTSPQDFGQWWVNFQLKTYELKNKNTRR